MLTAARRARRGPWSWLQGCGRAAFAAEERARGGSAPATRGLVLRGPAAAPARPPMTPTLRPAPSLEERGGGRASRGGVSARERDPYRLRISGPCGAARDGRRTRPRCAQPSLAVRRRMARPERFRAASPSPRARSHARSAAGARVRRARLSRPRRLRLGARRGARATGSAQLCSARRLLLLRENAQGRGCARELIRRPAALAALPASNRPLLAAARRRASADAARARPDLRESVSACDARPRVGELRSRLARRRRCARGRVAARRRAAAERSYERREPPRGRLRPGARGPPAWVRNHAPVGAARAPSRPGARSGRARGTLEHARFACRPVLGGLAPHAAAQHWHAAGDRRRSRGSQSLSWPRFRHARRRIVSRPVVAVARRPGGVLAIYTRGGRGGGVVAARTPQLSIVARGRRDLRHTHTAPSCARASSQRVSVVDRARGRRGRRLRRDRPQRHTRDAALRPPAARRRFVVPERAAARPGRPPRARACGPPARTRRAGASRLLIGQPLALRSLAHIRSRQIPGDPIARVVAGMSRGVRHGELG